MPRVNKVIDATSDEVEEAKNTAISLMKDSASSNAIDLFFSSNLVEIEQGIKRLNDFSNKSWLLSSILLYTLIYNKNLYMQSGLAWYDYSRQARERLGLEPRDITEQLSAARFFIRNHKALERAGFNPVGANRKLARAELATDLCKDANETIKHLVSDSWAEFNAWYSSFKSKPQAIEYKRDDIEIKKDKFYIKGVEAVTVSDSIPDDDRKKIESYIFQIFDALRKGYEPAIIEVYDKKEANRLAMLRDKERQKR